MSQADVHEPLQQRPPDSPRAGGAINPLACAYARRLPGEVAAHLSKRGADAVVKTLAELPDDVAAGVIARLPHGHAVHILAGRDDARIAALIDAAGLDHALAILLNVSTDRRQRILESLASRRKRRALRKLVVYPRDTTGAALDPTAARLEASMSLAEAVEFLRGNALEPERAIWLVDADGNYRGLLDSGSALAARTQLAALDEYRVRIKPLRAETTLTNASNSDQWLAHSELPVVDEHGHLLGSLTRARLMTTMGGHGPGNSALIDGMSDLAHQYFRVLGVCLGDLFDTRRPRR